jgi:hypothetical protein
MSIKIIELKNGEKATITHWINQPDYIGNTIELIEGKFIMTDKKGIKTENIDLRYPHYCEVQLNISATNNVLFSRIWEMPNSNTFDIKCINKLIHKYFNPEFKSIDPFANKNRIAKITNDLDPEMGTDYCMDALDFIKQFEDNSIDFVLYDPPYSPRQISECYKKLGRSVNMQTTQSSFWGNLKKEIARITKPNGMVISFGWNTNGIGKTKGFEIIEILMVAHGGSHNDTLCTVERKIK